MKSSFEISIRTPVTLAELKKVIDNIESLGYMAGPIDAAGYVHVEFAIPDSTDSAK